MPDPKVGEEICVYLRVREGVTLTEDDIREYCKDKVSYETTSNVTVNRACHAAGPGSIPGRDKFPR